MSGTSFDLLDTITVAIADGEHALTMASVGAELCQRAGKKLCLLHVVEPWAESPHSRPFGEKGPLWDVTQAVERNARDLAESRLAKLAAAMPRDVTVTPRVVAGKPTALLGPEALAAGSCLLLVGADFTNLRYVPLGLSTALSLLVSSPVPIGVFDPRTTTSLVAERTRLLIGDDLGPHAEAAVSFALGLGAALRNTDVRHVYVNALTLDNLRRGFVSAGGHPDADPAATAENVYEALAIELRGQLERRATDGGRAYLEAAGGAYAAEVVAGNVSDGIGTVAAAAAPHLMVFGRHHAYYMQPFSIGRLPYRAMLAQRRPLVVVPNEY